MPPEKLEQTILSAPPCQELLGTTDDLIIGLIFGLNIMIKSKKKDTLVNQTSTRMQKK